MTSSKSCPFGQRELEILKSKQEQNIYFQEAKKRVASPTTTTSTISSSAAVFRPVVTTASIVWHTDLTWVKWVIKNVHRLGNIAAIPQWEQGSYYY